MRKNIEAIYPLSPMQQGMLFHTLLAPESEVYFEQFHCTLSGTLSIDRFEEAWQKVTDRHPALRTAFVWENLKEPLQVVGRRVKIRIERHDWRAKGEEAAEEDFQRFLAEDRKKGFTLNKAPLMRLTLFQLGERRYRFLWSYHHLLLDGWCLSLILKEVLAFYMAAVQEKPIDLPPPRPYQDYIAWLKKQDLGAAEAFWRKHLRGFAAPTPLGIDRTAEGIETRNLDSHEREHALSETTTARVDAFCRAQRITTNNLIRGLWALLLARYAGEDDVLFGATVSGRPAELPGVESIVGLFINTLPVRVRIAWEASFGSFLTRLQGEELEARHFEYSPLVEIQGWSEVPRGTPLFESLLVFENYPLDAGLLDLGEEIGISDLHFVERTNLPLTLFVVPGKRLTFRALYHTARFEAEAIERMLGHLEMLLERALANPETPLARLSPLTEGERHLLLEVWNDTAVPDFMPGTIHGTFERQAAATPERVAARSAKGSITFGALDRQANRIAHALRRRGVAPEVPVALLAGRSIETLAAILGILKAGGAYLPLDPGYPKERLAFMLRDSGARFVVTTRAAWEPFEDFQSEIEPLFLDEAEELLLQEPETPLDLPISPHHPAYIVYTSGSTGRPKGVIGLHAGAVNRFEWMWRTYPFAEGEVGCQKTALSFVDSLWETFGPLGRGVPLVILDDGEVKDPYRLVEALRTHHVSRIVLVPSLLRVLLDTFPDLGSQLPDLEYWVTSGEAVTAELCRRFHSQVPHGVLLNIYGSSEVSADVTCFDTRQLGDAAEVPIGRPIANNRVYLLDARLDPVPIGVAGEIYVAGVGLARGYLHRPEMTAERFLPDPFGKGGVLYRTGDIGRYLPSGDIAYLGRRDHQVKIRGFRIELGEIEAALRAHPAVESAIVLLHGADRDPFLVAYVVFTRPCALEALRDFLAERLPRFMVPAHFVPLETLPLTPNGKVDRKRLPPPEKGVVRVRRPYHPPRTPTEEVIAEIWREILGVDRVGIHDAFFDLGGHSLKATQILSRLRQSFEVEVPLDRIFERPTVAGLAALIEECRQAGKNLPPIERIPRDPPPELSFAQQRLWFLDQLEPSSAYNIPAAVRIRGDLDPAVVERCIDALVARHEPLRTTFALIEGTPRQIVHPPAAWKVPVVRLDLSDLPEGEREQEAFAHARAAAAKRFDLSEGPLLRVLLIRIDTADHLLVLNMHHIVSDGWSLGVLIRELATLYPAGGDPSLLPPLPIQYADHAAWQRKVLAGETSDRLLAYWRKRLEDAPETLPLPTDKPRPAVQTFNGAVRLRRLAAPLLRQLEELSRQQGATLFMTLLAAFDVLLYRYSGASDIVVGTPISGRNRSEIEGLIGFFVNTLPLRADLSGNPPFTDLLRQVRERALEAYRHQDLPFERLIEALDLSRALSHSPLFQVMFILQNPLPPFEVPGLSFEPVPVESGGAKFDLTLSVAQGPHGNYAHVEFNTDLFEAGTMERFLEHFETLLTGIVEKPSTPILELPILSEGERWEVLRRWNDTAVELPQGFVHTWVSAHARAEPERTAVSFRDETITYGELDRASDRLAAHLHALGIRPGARVGVFLERCAELPTALLGILKAGGAYLPLDPEFPERRLRFMIEDAGLSLILVSAATANALPAAGKVPLLRIDDPGLEAVDPTPPEIELRPDDPVYLLYTSGSTGKPKGVEIPHRALVNCLAAFQRRPGFRREDTMLAVTTLSFDIAALEIFLPLFCGGRVVIADAEETIDMERLKARIVGAGVTVVQTTPARWRMLLAAGWPEASFRIWCGAEALPADLAAELLDHGELWNLYGPTEATIWATIHRVSLIEEGKIVPIGRPIANMEVFILDERLRPVPVGVPGEICIAGPGLARGYLNRPDLTAEKFVSLPLLGGKRVYRTGDLGRRRHDGTLEFLGRRDDQVKFRGHRIELGEIAANLEAHPAVRHCAVTMRGKHPGEEHLVAFYTSPSPPPDPEELRRFLGERLPDYMVPGFFVHLEALPLNPSGKVDKGALARIEVERPTKTFVAPRTPIETRIAEIWQEVLDIERVGVFDDFFALGGHSLLATRILARLRETFGADLPLRALFECRTVAGLAEAITARSGNASMLPPITPIPREGELPLSFAQQRLWFIEELQPGNVKSTIPGLVRIRGPLDVDLLRESLRDLCQRQESLRTAFGARGGRPFQRVVPEVEVPLDSVDLSEEADPDRVLHADAERRVAHPFDLSKPPLFRVTLYRLGPAEHVLLLVMHHIVSDGWSIEIFFRETTLLYAARIRGESTHLPPLTVQYIDHAYWQRRWMQGEVLQEQLGYWKRQLAGAPPALDLPTDRPRPPIQTFSGATETKDLPPALTEALKALAARRGATLFMLLLAAFKVLLSRLAGQEDVVVGTPSAGRTRRETEEIIGFFLNLLPLRTQISPSAAFLDLLEQVREVTLGALANQDVPFEKLLEELRIPRDLSRTPVFQVFFNMLNIPTRKTDLAGLEVEPMRAPEIGSKFDLTLYLLEREGGIHLELVYNPDLFDQERMARLLEQYEILLTQITEHPDWEVGRYDLRTPGEALPDPAEVLSPSWKAPAVHVAFAQVARREPERFAVADPSGRWRYGELAAWSHRLARFLRHGGVGKGDVVAIWAHRSASLVWGIMGALEAGGAFMILDPAYPALRIVDCLEQGRPKAFLSILPPDGEEDLPEAVERAIAHCPIRRALPPLGALAEGSFLAEFPAEPIDLPIGPDDLAYIAFTSGSTGRPKGVRGLHGALSHFLPWMAEHFGLGQEDRFSMLSGLSHDPLHRDIFTPLVLGAEIAIPDPAMIGTPGALATWMREAGITVAHLTPAMAELVTGEGKETIPSLHHVFFLGDRLHPRDVEGMRQIAPNVTCVNLYGATETSRAVGYYVVPEHGVPEEIPAGRGIGDVQLLLLNPLGRPTALGEVGEIHVRSPFLCGGYLDDEGLTRTRFGTNPFRDDPADRIYKTGDLGRYLADGNVAFLGRRDGQIKLRGFRIELTEIARHLEAYPGIAEAEVLLHPLPAGEALVAYIAGDPERSAQADEIRAFLRTRLPDYMIPARFIPLSQLPRTPNGKIDRGALPLPQEIRPQTPFVPPRNPLETRLAEIFGQILNVEKVGVFDNFFELGGHSLLATQLLSRIRDAFQVELPLRTIFEAPHIAGLAEAVTAARADGPAAQPPPITRVSRESRKIRRVTQPTPPSPPKG